VVKYKPETVGVTPVAGGAMSKPEVLLLNKNGSSRVKLKQNNVVLQQLQNLSKTIKYNNMQNKFVLFQRFFSRRI
jgi:hypothetical protein